MITLIGNTQTCIGFGLCGITEVHEIPVESKTVEIEALIVGTKNNIILIDNVLKQKIKSAKLLDEKIVIGVPGLNEKEHADEIETIIQHTLGIQIEGIK